MSEVDTGAVAWLLAATSFVVLMTFGVGLFYGGLSRRKNAISTIMLSYISVALVTLQWVLIGYSLSFAPSVLGGFIGGLDHVGLAGLGDAVSGVPAPIYVAFQGAFAAITAALLTSALVERVKVEGFMLFIVLWATLVYAPLAHWVWGGGWLHRVLGEALGAAPLDFAGGTVVHIDSGFSALALVLAIGARRWLEGRVVTPPHNVPLALLGMALIWFGWFGFNAGSALAADESAANALLVTHVAASAGAVTWSLISLAKTGRLSSVGFASGALAGLVAITPAAGYVDALSAIAIGVAAAIVSFYALEWRVRRGIDESLDAWAVHGMSGVVGAVLTGVFAREAIGGVPGLIEGNAVQVASQAISAVVAAAYAFAVTYILAKAVDKLVGLRAREEEEYVGLDVAKHGEEAYSWQ